MGRPSSYKPEFATQAEKLCLLGATDQELADFFEVDVRTVYRWKHDHDEFCQALKSGKDEADERVVRSLYQKAIGYDVIEQQAVKLKTETGGEVVEVVEVRKHVQSDTTAAIFWAKNRRSDEWRDVKHIDGRREITHRHELSALSTEQLEAIEAIIDQSDGVEGGASLALPAPLH